MEEGQTKVVQLIQVVSLSSLPTLLESLLAWRRYRLLQKGYLEVLKLVGSGLA